jgi:hypothetical protein
LWLNRQFAKLLPLTEYESKHDRLETRVRELEMWASTKSFFAATRKQNGD